jgi:hypothetical protein
MMRSSSNPLSNSAIDPLLLGVRFWIVAGLGILLKFALTSDLSVQITFAPHDDTLYVERAYQLLLGNAFGPYDSRILIKYPGLSVWLAAVRSVGIPFLLSVNLVYIAAGCYFAAGLRKCGYGPAVVLGAFLLYLMNPVTLGSEWFRVIREPLATGLLVTLMSAMLHIAVSLEQRRPAWMHAWIFVLTFPFAIFVREEDRLLWGLLALFGLMLSWRIVRSDLAGRRRGALIGVIVIGGAAVAGIGVQHLIRGWVDRTYGAPIIHEFTEGEYPRLLAAIRSVESGKDNRLVMAPQEVLQKLRVEVPQFAPVIDRLPPVGRNTISCQLYGVCTEWANGWMPFWIKDAAFSAGLTPDLPHAQEYFRKVRTKIEEACSNGRLRCKRKGGGLVPPMEIRWMRAFGAEALHLVGLTLYPQANVLTSPSLGFGVPPYHARHYQAVTMTDYIGPTSVADFNELGDRRPYANPGGERTRPLLASFYQPIAFVLLILGACALIYRMVVSGRQPLGPFASVAMIVALYLSFRIAALSYVAVYLGRFDSRIVFSTYVVGTLLALPLLADALRARSHRR